MTAFVSCGERCQKHQTYCHKPSGHHGQHIHEDGEAVHPWRTEKEAEGCACGHLRGDHAADGCHGGVVGPDRDERRCGCEEFLADSEGRVVPRRMSWVGPHDWSGLSGSARLYVVRGETDG